MACAGWVVCLSLACCTDKPPRSPPPSIKTAITACLCRRREFCQSSVLAESCVAARPVNGPTSVLDPSAVINVVFCRTLICPGFWRVLASPVYSPVSLLFPALTELPTSDRRRGSAKSESWNGRWNSSTMSSLAPACSRHRGMSDHARQCSGAVPLPCLRLCALALPCACR